MSFKQLVQQIPGMSDLEIKLYSGCLVELWYAEYIESFDCPKAFALLKYTPIRDSPSFTPLMYCALQARQYQKNKSYSSLSETNRNQFLNRLHQALEPFEHMNQWFQLIPESDKWLSYIRPAYEAQFVFRRDPENSIDLQAFSQDEESVHRSSTQSMIAESLAIITRYPLADKQQTLEEIIGELVWIETGQEFVLMDILTQDYQSLTVPLFHQTVRYSDVMDHVWAYIRNHPFREELVRRLLEELMDSMNVCANGKLARLLNVLQGYDVSLPQSISMDGFQERMARLREAPQETRILAANTLFEDYRIPEGQRGGWLQAVME